MKIFYVIFALLCGSGAVNAQDLSDDYKNGVMYHSKARGGVIEDMYIDKSAIVALQKDGVLPNGARIVMEEYANQNGKKGALNRYIAMQKRGKAWEFSAYNADGSLNRADNPTRCLNCHRESVRGEDIVFTIDKLKAFRFDEIK